MGMLFKRTAVAAICVAALATGCGEPYTDIDSEPPGFTPTPTHEVPGADPSPGPATESAAPPGVRSPVPAPAASPPPAPRAPVLPKGYVPPALVGEWDGDNKDSAQLARIVFTADGYVVLRYNNGRVLTGPALVGNSSMALYVPGGPIRFARWSVSEFDAGYGYTFENLVLDGVSYVRQTGGDP
ncbi:hypothetical protein ACFWUQ_23530 [Streptomyces sp. NPDC058662]|uniref:hypothetical protein n=1 Tax=Streptomyces sp. NPDC058662 TaxID=3346583 RepID=UPI0036585FE1